jgi:hypothetical protein
MRLPAARRQEIEDTMGSGDEAIKAGADKN